MLQRVAQAIEEDPRKYAAGVLVAHLGLVLARRCMAMVGNGMEFETREAAFRVLNNIRDLDGVFPGITDEDEASGVFYAPEGRYVIGYLDEYQRAVDEFGWERIE